MTLDCSFDIHGWDCSELAKPAWQAGPVLIGVWEWNPNKDVSICVLGQSPSSLTGHPKLQGHSIGVEFFSAEGENRSVSVEVSIAKKKQLKMLL